MKKQVIAYLHTHWDREWYQTHEEFNLRLLEVMDEILAELESGAAPCFYLDGQTDALDSYLKFRSKNLERIKKLIAAKKLYIGPFAVSADSFLTGGWNLIKNLQFGIERAKSLGCKDFIGYLPDTFGHSRGIFEILKYFGIKNAILWRGTGFLPSEFVFNGVNTTRLVQGYFMDILHSKMPENARIEALEAFLDKIAKYSVNEKILLPIGADHLKILENAADTIKKANKNLKKYEIKLSSPFEYFKNLKYKKNIKGELLNNDANYILQGVYSARIYQKVHQARLSWLLGRIVEPLDLIYGARYKQPLDFAYHELIKNHAHDSLYGCSIDEVHRQVDTRFEKVSEVAYGVLERLKRDICAVKTNGDTRICAINMSDFNYSVPLRIKTTQKIKNGQLISKTMGFAPEKLYDIAQIPVTEDFRPIYEYLIQVPQLKPFSINVLEPKIIKDGVKITPQSLQNSEIEFFIKNKKIGFKNKKTGEILNDCLKIFDTKDLGDSYNFAPAHKPCELPLLKTKIVEKGPLRSILRLFYKNIKLDVILYACAKHIEFRANIDNKTKNHKLQAAFALKNPVNQTVAQDTLGLIKREHDPSYSLLKNLPAKNGEELKTNFYPMQKFVCAQGVGIATVGLNEYEVSANTLSIALLRAFGVISNPKNPARAIPAGPPLEVPEAQCLGANEANFAFAFLSPEEMFQVSQEVFGTTVAFEIKDDKNSSKQFLKPQKGKILCGLKSSHEAIFYDIKTGVLEDIQF